MAQGPPGGAFLLYAALEDSSAAEPEPLFPTPGIGNRGS